MFARLSHVGSLLVDWLTPQDCLGCSTEAAIGHGFCDVCTDALELSLATRLAEYTLVAPFCHRGPVRHAIHQLKYSDRPDYARRLVMTAFSTQRLGVVGQATLIPVPLHPLRLVERGYNQAALLARALGKLWRLPTAYDLLVREASTGSQVGRNRAERVENMRSAFRVQCSRAMPTSVWLVDDVVTTGATARSCAQALGAAGVLVAGIIALSHAASPCSAETQ